jgi:transcriptional regulator with XRE-family HTH domain
MPTNDLISVLRERRRLLDMRQSEVGARIGLSASEVSRIENGRRRFPLHLVDDWADALGLRIDVAVKSCDEGGVHVSSQLTAEAV